MTNILFVIVRISGNQFKCNYLKNQKLFLIFFAAVLNLSLSFNFFFLKMIAIAYVIPKLQTVKDLVRQISKKPRFGTLFHSQNVERYQTLLESARQHF